MSPHPKIFYILLFCIIHSVATPVTAQVEKGRLRLGGSISAAFHNSTTENLNGSSVAYSYEVDQTVLNFSPLGGIFLADGLELGISPAISWNKRSSEMTTPGSTSTDLKGIFFQVGPYANYYVGSGEKGKPFVGAASTIGWGSGESDAFDQSTGTSYEIKTHSKNWSVTLTAGYAVFLNDSYLLSFFGGYEYRKSENEIDESNYSSIDKTGMFTLGVSISTTFKR